MGEDDGYDRPVRAGAMAQAQVWCRLADDPVDAYQYVLEPRPWGIVLGRRGSRGMSRAYAKSMDLLDVLRSADVRSRGEKSYRLAADAYAKVATEDGRRWGALAQDVFPDLYVSLDHMAHARLRKSFDRVLPERRDQDGRVTDPARVMSFATPDGFEATACRWVGVDVDDVLIPWTAVDGESDASDAFPIADQRGIGSAGDAVLKRAAESIQARVERHPLFTGRVGLVRTGPRGVQVVAELEATRWSTAELWRDADFRAMVENLADLVLAEVRAAGCDGGHADPSAMSAGRYFRRPGWRIAKDRSLFRARLIFSSP